LLNESQQAGSADVALPWFANFIGADVEMMAPAWRCVWRVWFLWVLPLAALRPERETEDLDAKNEEKQSISSIRAAMENLRATESYILRRIMPVRREKWAADAVPNPMSNPLQCGLHAPGFLCDPDHLLTENERLKVEEALVAIHEDTQLLCPDGTNHSYQAGVLVVSTVSSSESLGWWNKETMAEAFAKKVQDAWGVGDAGCDNGVVLLISVGDGLFYIKTAEKAREVLTDRTAGRIADNVRPHLKNGRVGEAILLGCSDIRLALRGYTVPVYFSWFDCFLIVSAGIFFCMNLPQILSGFFMFLVLVLGLLLYPFAKLADAMNWCWWKIRTHGIKEDLERIQKELEKDEFSQSLCPICLENFCDAGSDRGVRKLECKHGFHAACIDNWLRESECCPFCRFVDLRLSDDQRKAERGQRRLRFYLSRLSARYPGSTFDSTGSRPLFVSSSSWAQSLNTSLRSAMVTSTQIGAIGPGASGGRFAGGGW